MSIDERLLNVNRDGVLAVPAAFWLAGLVSVRYVLFVMLTFIAAKRSDGVMSLLSGGIPWPAMLGELPVLALLWAAGSRKPGSGRGPRWLWQHAYVLVCLTTLAHLTWALWLIVDVNIEEVRKAVVLSCFSLLDLSISWVFWRSHYYRQLFSEFPDAPSASVSK